MSFSYCKKDYFYTMKITTKTTIVCYLPYKLFCNFDLNEKHWNFKFCNEFLLKWMKSFCKGKLHWNIIMTVQSQTHTISVLAWNHHGRQSHSDWWDLCASLRVYWSHLSAPTMADFSLSSTKFDSDLPLMIINGS